MSNPAIEVNGLSVSFNRKKVLNDLTFSVESGEFVAVVGPNGSGKTTMIRAILGLIPHKGDVLIYGKKAREARKRIGYVPQRFDFDRSIPITVSEFLKMPFPKTGARKMKRVLLEVDMKSFEDAPLGSLSGGQLQRVLIARALVNDPSLLVLDEATSAVDTAGAKGFYDIISHLRSVHGTTVVLVSHEVNMVYRYADHIVCLNRDLICYGKPEEAVTQKVLEKLYGKDVKFQEHRH